MSKSTPTLNQFKAFEDLFLYFNLTLFDGILPKIILNLSRDKRAYGTFRPSCWKHGEIITHEISINPEHLNRHPKDVASTIVHEMCHLWQQDFGTKIPKGNYHNREFSRKMFSVGLMTSKTGKKGGDTIGSPMSHYILEGGVFEQAYNNMPEDIKLPWINTLPLLKEKSIEDKNRATGKLKVTYRCIHCEITAWGKEGLYLICGSCKQPLTDYRFL